MTEVRDVPVMSLDELGGKLSEERDYPGRRRLDLAERRSRVVLIRCTLLHPSTPLTEGSMLGD